MAPDLDCSSPTDEMKGYLRKSRKWNRRFFVLRETPPPRLECYDSEKKYSLKGKPKRTINLENAWNIDKKVTSKHKFLIGLYTEEEYFAMSADNITIQEMWVNALQKAVLCYRGGINRTHTMYRHIWQGNVDTKDLESCNNNVRINLQGQHRCCLTDKTMVFIRLNHAGAADLQRNNHVEITIASIRSCGHKDNLFFMEPGRSSGIGTGKLWMELDDSAIADDMHTTILRFMYSLGQDDSTRPRSYSSGSGSSRSGARSRHYYNPPPSQVGMGKPASTAITPTGAVPSLPKHVRTRCESFPATHISGLTDEARYRTSSEGEQSMKRPYPFHTLRCKPGSISPSGRMRVWSHGKPPLHLQSIIHSRTCSLPGSYTSSSNSSIEHLNVNNEGTAQTSNGQTGEGNHSSDEFSSSPLAEHSGHGQLQHLIFAHNSRSTTPPPSRTPPLFDPHHRSSLQFHLGNVDLPMDRAPPPPTIPPETYPFPTTTTASNTSQHEYVNVQPAHSRSQSLDDNLSCGTGASSLSTSPQISGYLANVSMSPDANYMYSQSPSQGSSHSQSGDYNLMYVATSASPNGLDCGDYTCMNYGSAENYPHESGSLQAPDYTPMTSGKGAASPSSNSGLIEDKSGYVPMRPLVRSQPQDISSSRRRSLSDNRLVNGSYSPVSPLSRSPDKASHASRGPASSKSKRAELPHSYPCHCAPIAVTVQNPAIPPVSCHGLKVNANNDFSHDASRSKVTRSREFQNLSSSDYACMNGLSRNLNDIHLRPSSGNGGQKQIKSPGTTQPEPLNSESSGADVDHEYLHMNPMVVGAVLSVAESRSSTFLGHSNPQYPHQLNVARTGLNYSTNSLDRSKHVVRKRAASLFSSTLVPKQRHSTKTPKHGKKPQRISSDSRAPTTESASSSSYQQRSPGGEYVSINFDKAKKQVGPSYVSLSESSSGVLGDSENSDAPSKFSNNQSMGTPKATHDSNRNLLSTKPGSPTDDYMSIKPGEPMAGP